ncbi:pyridoxal phosphate-dependent decarboxylase family protein [Micromonospora chersina]|uniref:pyridoxal phosphate-dependent decarboxylase family protein n=1 Tax=Micromonospora chersina TaxID=47854 RepID=UPI00372173BD
MEELANSEGISDTTFGALSTSPDILVFSENEMRRLGYQVVDAVIAHILNVDSQRPAATASDDVLTSALDGPLPNSASALDVNLTTLVDVLTTYQQHEDHKRYFARVPGPTSFPAILGDWLATGMQATASSWQNAPGPSTAEIVVCQWLGEALGLEGAWDGILVSGGSVANLTAIVTARACNGPGTIYLSDQTHASVMRALASIGWAPKDIRVIPSDRSHRFDTAALATAVLEDISAGRKPSVVVATAGTTNTGAVDDLDTIAKICAEHGLWLHVDAAYGGAAAICDQGRAHLSGLSKADSLVIDPHKWMFQPFDIGCLLVKHPGCLERTFAMSPEYLADISRGTVNFYNRGLELTRRSRALKLWITFQTYGRETLASAIARCMALAEFAQRIIELNPLLQVVTPAQLGIVTFEAPHLNDAGHADVIDRLTSEGFAVTSSTVLDGRTVLRLCTINPRTTTDDIRDTIEHIDKLTRSSAPEFHRSSTPLLT